MIDVFMEMLKTAKSIMNTKRFQIVGMLADLLFYALAQIRRFFFFFFLTE